MESGKCGGEVREAGGGDREVGRGAGIGSIGDMGDVMEKWEEQEK